MSKITETSYIPPFTVTDEITSLVIEIAETIVKKINKNIIHLLLKVIKLGIVRFLSLLC